MKQIHADFENRLQGIPGAIVEDKGLTLSVHYRTVPEDRRDEVRRIVHSALANASHPFLLREGRMVYEIRPRAYWNKGHAVTWLREHVAQAHRGRAGRRRRQRHIQPNTGSLRPSQRGSYNQPQGREEPAMHVLESMFQSDEIVNRFCRR